MNSKNKMLLSSIASIALCSSIAVGGTFALFTSEQKVNVAVTAGKVKVTAEIVEESLKTSSSLSTFNYQATEENGYTANFENGGTATFSNADGVQILKLTNVTPGDKAEFQIKATNESNVSIQYRFAWAVDGELSEALEATVQEEDAEVVKLVTNKTEWAKWEDADNVKTFNVVVYLPETVDNTYQEQKASISFLFEAVQSNGVDYYGNTSVKTAEELTVALSRGEDVILMNDIADAPVNTKAPYGNYYGVALNGGVLNGNGKKLDFNEGELHNGSLDNYGIMTSGGTIKNAAISGVFRGIMIMNPTEDVYVDNVTLGGEDMCYTINTGESDHGAHNLVVTNSTIKGWTSYGNNVLLSASFTNCSFEQGEYCTNIYGRVLKPYSNTTLTNCSFVEHMNLDLSSLANGHKIIITNCTVNGEAITAASFTIPTTDAEYDTELFTVDLPSWANELSDCIIFQ